MKRTKRLYIVGSLVAVLALAAIGTSFAMANGGDDGQPLTGTALEQASEAALAHTGGGTVVDSEAGDDGSVVEVNLDENFAVTGQEADDDGPNDQDRATDG